MLHDTFFKAVAVLSKATFLFLEIYFQEGGCSLKSGLYQS